MKEDVIMTHRATASMDSNIVDRINKKLDDFRRTTGKDAEGIILGAQDWLEFNAVLNSYLAYCDRGSYKEVCRWRGIPVMVSLKPRMLELIINASDAVYFAENDRKAGKAIREALKED